MKTYYSTFITGFSDVVKQALKDIIKDVQIDELSDGLIIYRTDSSIEEIKKLRFFNNSFILFQILKGLDPNLPNPFVKQVIRDPDLQKWVDNNLPILKASFRVIISKENELIKIHSEILKKIEDRLVEVSKWRVERANPGYEFWFILRREGIGLFGLRITRHGNYEKILEKGELRPELSHILSLISEPSKEDIFLDPFAGSGSIPIERINLPYKQVLAGDIELNLVDKIGKRNNQIKVYKLDATDLRTIQGQSIDKIVTDPPWGLHSGVNLDLEDFYNKILKEFKRILKKSGILVIVVAKKELFEDILSQYKSELNILDSYTTLVNGQKAAIYKIGKR